VSSHGGEKARRAHLAVLLAPIGHPFGFLRGLAAAAVYSARRLDLDGVGLSEKVGLWWGHGLRLGDAGRLKQLGLRVPLARARPFDQ
jgi:hypothetical protein